MRDRRNRQARGVAVGERVSAVTRCTHSQRHQHDVIRAVGGRDVGGVPHIPRRHESAAGPAVVPPPGGRRVPWVVVGGARGKADGCPRRRRVRRRWMGRDREGVKAEDQTDACGVIHSDGRRVVRPGEVARPLHEDPAGIGHGFERHRGAAVEGATPRQRMRD